MTCQVDVAIDDGDRFYTVPAHRLSGNYGESFPIEKHYVSGDVYRTDTADVNGTA